MSGGQSRNRTLYDHNEQQPLIFNQKPSYDEVIDDNESTAESELERQYACRGMTIIASLLFATLITLRYATSWFFLTENPSPEPAPDSNTCPDNIPFCDIVQPNNKLHVSRGHKGFPSFWDYGAHGSYNVSYDGRSLLLNGDRALFLSGSLHPIRATKQTWEHALDEAVHNGLNMITIYVFWAEHQPLPNQTIDWTLPAGRGVACTQAHFQPSYCGWSLGDAIRAAAERGFFVHARVGPYVCAEYNYGGIPEWVPLHKPDMKMRRLNQAWLEAMGAYVKSTVDYLTREKLFAYQGGPIVMAQIENELGGAGYDDENESNDNNSRNTNNDDDLSNIPIMKKEDYSPAHAKHDTAAEETNNWGIDDAYLVNIMDDDDSIRVYQEHDKKMVAEKDADQDGRMLQISSTDGVASIRRASVQDYADWCGSFVKQLAPHVIWTMCNGLSANNTIVTCNGWCTDWLDKHGTSGRIQVDQPALWTEDEGGFQIWGDDPNNQSDYFWGRPAHAMAYDALRWFARGGTHLNYYMWWGGYNRGRASASGIMNSYATDAPVCSCGQRHEPKFTHFQALHEVVRHVAYILLETPTALNQSILVEHLDNNNDRWVTNGKQLMFVYKTNSKEVAFVENNDQESVLVRLLFGTVKKEVVIVEMKPMSVLVIKNGSIKFDSSSVSDKSMSFERKTNLEPTKIFGWSSCAEPVGVLPEDPDCVTSSSPMEQTLLNIDAGVSSDYAWYQTDFELDYPLEDVIVSINSQKGSALMLFIDGMSHGEAYNRFHAEGNVTFLFRGGELDKGRHTLAILCESLGYFNLVGRWGSGTSAKVKGITGPVTLVSNAGNHSLNENVTWKSSPGLNGGENGFCQDVKPGTTIKSSVHPSWSTAMFNTPGYDPSTQALFLRISLGRGHVWLNGHDLGRFWNITRGNTRQFSQEYYFLPFDFLDPNGSVNRLVFFDALGNDLSSTQLVLSWLEKTDSPTFQDEVDFPGACM